MIRMKPLKFNPELRTRIHQHSLQKSLMRRLPDFKWCYANIVWSDDEIHMWIEEPASDSSSTRTFKLKRRSTFQKLLHAPIMFWELYQINHDVTLCKNLVINYIKQEP